MCESIDKIKIEYAFNNAVLYKFYKMNLISNEEFFNLKNELLNLENKDLKCINKELKN